MKSYRLYSDKYTCNKLGIAEFFAKHYMGFSNAYGKTVLDVGCGVFPLGIFLADQYHCNVVGIDINPIAYKCSVKNIKHYKLDDRCLVINDDFSKPTLLDTTVEYDLIISVPPIDNSVSKDKIEKYSNDRYESINDEKFSYITNSWHSIEGRDLLDYIFDFSRSNLKSNGHVIISVCLMDCVTKEYILDKAHMYDLKETRVIEGNISGKSIGVESLGIDDVSTTLIEFQRR